MAPDSMNYICQINNISEAVMHRDPLLAHRLQLILNAKLYVHHTKIVQMIEYRDPQIHKHTIIIINEYFFIINKLFMNCRTQQNRSGSIK